MKAVFESEATPDGNVRLALVINDEAVWPHPHKGDGSAEFDPEDVLSYLADAWPSLLLAQAWPIPFGPDQEPRSITGLLRAAEERWEELGTADSSLVDDEGVELDAFLYAHDFSQMKHGAALSPCFVLRQNEAMRVETNGGIYEGMPFGEFIDELADFGALAAGILKSRPDPAAAHVLERWQAREKVDPISAAALLSGLPRGDIIRSPELQATLVADIAALPLSAIANDNGPIPAAARSSGVLGPASLTETLRRIKALPDGDVREVVKLRNKVDRDLRDIRHPLDQGVRAADIVRRWLRLSDDMRVDLELLSKTLKIRVERSPFSDRRMDGIATIGPAYGPSILLNTNTRRHGASPDDLERSIRFTWAHEIGHLILDCDAWPALVDAAKQRVPRSVETRANAFAAYLLLPQSAALRCWEQSGAPLAWPVLEQVLNQLTEHFGLPRIVASRQLARAAQPERRKLLEEAFRTYVANFDGSGSAS